MLCTVVLLDLPKPLAVAKRKLVVCGKVVTLRDCQRTAEFENAAPRIGPRFVV